MMDIKRKESWSHILFGSYTISSLINSFELEDVMFLALSLFKSSIYLKILHNLNVLK